MMEFPFNVNGVLKERITLLRGGTRRREGKDCEHENELMKIVNDMGIASAKAQGLKSPITVYSRLIQASGQCLYILKDSVGQGSVLGFIKTGRKRLFLMDHYTLLHEVEPLSILDFYVHESQQRKGHGKVLFEHVLMEEGLEPFEVAIDRPSMKFLSFLKRHYHLTSHIKQNNNFVVFDKFFTTCSHIDYGHGNSTYRRHSLPQTTERRNHTPYPRMSLSPKRTEWFTSHNSSSKLVSLKESSLSPPTVPNTTPPPQAKPVSITSLTSSSDENNSSSSGTSIKTPTWDLSKLSQLKTTPITNEVVRAPHLNMRSRHPSERGQGAWLDASQWGCSSYHSAMRYPGVQYSRYNCDREKKSSTGSSSCTNNSSVGILPSGVSSSFNNKRTSGQHWKDYLR